MEDKKEYCQQLYSKYEELKRKTEMMVTDLRETGGEIDVSYIALEDMKEKNKVKEELHNCLNILSDEQLIELYDDHDFMEDAAKILGNRKLNRH